MTDKIDSVPNLYLLKQRANFAKKSARVQLKQPVLNTSAKTTPLREVRVDELDKEALGIELNRHGFRGMKSRPFITNVYDSRQERFA